MKNISTILLTLCFITLFSKNSFADLGDNGVHAKKISSKKIAEKLTTAQINWKFEQVSSIKQISFVRSLDNNLPAFTSEEIQSEFIRSHKKLVILNWLVECPKPEATYIIERGTYDYNDFVEIGRIDPAQRNIENETNSFMDTEAPIGLFQYRIVEKIDCVTTAAFTPATTVSFIQNPTGISLKVSLK
jgi:hypothetical protein